jgi:signal transduction histidine kinase
MNPVFPALPFDTKDKVTQPLPPDSDSRTSQSRTARLLELQDPVFAEWERRVRAQVPQASGLPHPILINTFPVMYQELIERISSDSNPSCDNINTVASEHGGERARLTHYDPQSVIAEYQLLRWTLFDVLSQHGAAPEDGEARAINAYIDTAIQQAINSFALVQSALRERFVAALTHDLRNPLQVIAGAAELIRHSDDIEKIRSLAERILGSNQRMDRMISELLDSVAFQSGERLRMRLSRFDLLDVITEVQEQMQQTHGDRFDVSAVNVEGWWGREEMKRALENLIGNAIKYGAPDTRIGIGLLEKYQRITLWVHNLGPPIPPDQLEDVFQVFRRAESARNGGQAGWGLGLPYVRSVAESHGGSVSMESSALKGTRIIIDVPVDARPYQSAPTFG